MLQLFRRFSLLFLLALAASRPVHAGCNEIVGGGEKPSSAIDHTVPSGIVKHGEHFVDLMFGQAGSESTRYLSSFETLVERLLQYARNRKVPRVNEKIDGSPSVVLGYTEGDQPFITYKADFSNKTQRLVTSPEVAKEVGFKPGLADLFGQSIPLFTPVMLPLAQSEFKNYLFQGDLLFSPGNDRIIRTPELITITSNVVSYQIRKGSPYFEALSKAKVGIVLHTFGKRVVDADGRLDFAPTGSEDTRIIEEFISKLQSDDVFVISPWRDGVELSGAPIAPATETQVRILLEEIRTLQGQLTPEFKEAWRTRHEKRFRIFFNSHLRAPSDGGFYLHASKGGSLDLNQILADFNAWLEPRLLKGTEPKSYRGQWEQFKAAHETELRGLIQAYHDSIHIQYLLAPHLKEMFRSKLGGGEVEGIMLQTPDTIVKLVDRLDFTLRNNIQNNRAVLAAPPVDSGSPFATWNPGALFIVMKGQPIHSGHLQMIKQTVKQNPGKEVYLLVSDKEPNLQATEWKDLKLADKKMDLAAHQYTYIFDRDLRRKILEAGLDGVDVKILFGSPNEFWSYVARADANSETGKVKLVVGEKEIEAKRYADLLEKHKDHLDAEVIKMQSGGISATQVRTALEWYHNEDFDQKSVYGFLERAYSEIADLNVRRALIDQMLEAWRRADEAAQNVLAQEAAAKEAKKNAKPKKAAPKKK